MTGNSQAPPGPPPNGESREWGPWSVWKTELILGGYLPRFAKAGAGSQHRTFIDCYAGGIENFERGTGRLIESSTTLAFQTIPEFSHLLLFELADKAKALRDDLRSKYPGRKFEVFPGDVNSEIRAGLKWWRVQGTETSGPHLGQALAYLDPDNHGQLAWGTVERIARFCADRGPSGEYRRIRPPEQLILLPTGTLRRQLPTAEGSARASTSEVMKATRMFGTDEWLRIYTDQRKGVLQGDEGWRWYAELFRQQLRALGYSHVSAIETRNTRNVMQYHLVFASNHLAGRSIMKSVMEQASRVLPEKLREDRERLTQPGQTSLFDHLHHELEAIASSPASYACLMTERPQAYEPGSGATVPVERPAAPSPPKRTIAIDQMRLPFIDET